MVSVVNMEDRVLHVECLCGNGPFWMPGWRLTPVGGNHTSSTIGSHEHAHAHTHTRARAQRHQIWALCVNAIDP